MKGGASVTVSFLPDGTALIDIPAGIMPDREALEKVCKLIKEKRRSARANMQNG